jgi:two-component system sensor histidine kinase KdpD
VRNIDGMKRSGPWSGYAFAIGAAALCSLIGWTMQPRFDLVNVAMVYLLAVVVIALRFPRGPAIAASVLAVAAFDLLFVPPTGRFTIDDAQYLLTFAIMLAVALVISRLVGSVRRRTAAQAALEIEAETERIRSALLASISHDLRTPLAVMAGASSSLAESGERMSAEERRALAASVFDQAREMSEHVAKILEMTRLETGAVRAERDWAALPEIVGAVLARLSERLATHRIVVELPPDLPLVRVDATLIEQALGNLLENCARHTPTDTIVRVRAQHRADDVVVSVEDYGGGRSDAELARAFAKFSRGTVEGGGTDIGLGLAICRAIVRLHGGQAWAEHAPGGGTAFRFSLPLEVSPAVPPEPAPDVEEPLPGPAWTSRRRSS